MNEQNEPGVFNPPLCEILKKISKRGTHRNFHRYIQFLRKIIAESLGEPELYISRIDSTFENNEYAQLKLLKDLLDLLWLVSASEYSTYTEYIEAQDNV